MSDPNNTNARLHEEEEEDYDEDGVAAAEEAEAARARQQIEALKQMRMELGEEVEDEDAAEQNAGDEDGTPYPSTPTGARTAAAAAGSAGSRPSPALSASEAEAQAVDDKSVHVGNLDPTTTPQDLQVHFESVGVINRITILVDKFTGRPKGFAYVEFADPSLVDLALGFNETVLKGRSITVTPKRKNVPRFMLRGRGTRGGFVPRGRGGYRGGPQGGPPRGGFRGRRFAPY